MEKAPSSDIASRLEATRDELAAVERSLASLPARKETLLGQPELDEKALAKIEEQEATLVKKKSQLEQRIPLLEKQAEQEAAQQAQHRLAQLVTESAEQARTYDTLLASFHVGAEQVKLASERVIAAFRTLQACHDEQEFLVARFGIEAAELSSPSAPVPHDDTAENILKPLADFWQRQNSLAARNEWGEKLHRLEKERREERQQQTPGSIPGHVRSTIA